MMTACKESISEICLDIAVYALRDVGDEVMWFIRDLGQAGKELPEEFDVTGDGWKEAERRIDDACAARDLETLCNACSEYRQRAARFLNAWRVKLGMPSKELGF